LERSSRFNEPNLALILLNIAKNILKNLVKNLDLA